MYQIYILNVQIVYINDYYKAYYSSLQYTVYVNNHLKLQLYIYSQSRSLESVR